MTYELPRTDDGEVDWATVETDLDDDPWGWVTILKAIDTNARAEEREACAAICDAKAGGYVAGSFRRIVSMQNANEIRARGDRPMTTKRELLDLAKRAEAGENLVTSTFGDEAFVLDKIIDGQWQHLGAALREGSLDAAKSLHDAVKTEHASFVSVLKSVIARIGERDEELARYCVAEILRVKASEVSE